MIQLKKKFSSIKFSALISAVRSKGLDKASLCKFKINKMNLFIQAMLVFLLSAECFFSSAQTNSNGGKAEPHIYHLHFYPWEKSSSQEEKQNLKNVFDQLTSMLSPDEILEWAKFYKEKHNTSFSVTLYGYIVQQSLIPQFKPPWAIGTSPENIKEIGKIIKQLTRRFSPEEIYESAQLYEQDAVFYEKNQKRLSASMRYSAYMLYEYSADQLKHPPAQYKMAQMFGGQDGFFFPPSYISLEKSAYYLEQMIQNKNTPTDVKIANRLKLQELYSRMQSNKNIPLPARLSIQKEIPKLQWRSFCSILFHIATGK